VRLLYKSKPQVFTIDVVANDKKNQLLQARGSCHSQCLSNWDSRIASDELFHAYSQESSTKMNAIGSDAIGSHDVMRVMRK
jgi:hypothetical protein